MANQKSAYERLQLIRHKERPNLKDYIPLIFDEFYEMHGDRLYGDDRAILGGIGVFEGQTVTVIGHLKGKNINENKKTNFGMPHPEGYRKALRLMKQAEKFHRPVICFIDTSGAFCGIEAEQRGQGEAIAKNLLEMSDLKVPVVSIVMGEGGSGGALALGVCDEFAMLSNAICSVISPRGFASILWKDPTREEEAANMMRITAQDLYKLGVCDAIIEEADGAAHKNVEGTAENIKRYLEDTLAKLETKSIDDLLRERYEKYRAIGMFEEM
jgi:acetyl-coA carboxylase, carboxyl transferase, alpha subunit